MQVTEQQPTTRTMRLTLGEDHLQKFVNAVALLLVDADDVPGDVLEMTDAADACSGVDEAAREAARAYAKAYERFASEVAPHLRVLEAAARQSEKGREALEIVDEARAFPAREKN